MEEPAKLTKAQIESILALLKSFGADEPTIDNVDVALSQQIPVNLKIHWVVLFLLAAIVWVQTYTPIAALTNLISIVDSYLRIVLNSWPAILLILGIILLVKYKTSIAIFIEKRITSIGPSGISAAAQADVEKREDIATVQPAATGHGASDEIKRIKFFERLYAAVYGSQINLLIKLNEIQGSLSIAEAAQFYIKAVGKNPDLKKYPYPDYLNFLTSVNLIKLSGDFAQGTVQITPLGKDFLTYMTTNDLSFEKPN